MNEEGVKTLYETTIAKLFVETYYCLYCDLIDTDKKTMQEHITQTHDETGKLIKLFECQKCNKYTNEYKIIKHITKYH